MELSKKIYTYADLSFNPHLLTGNPIGIPKYRTQLCAFHKGKNLTQLAPAEMDTAMGPILAQLVTPASVRPSEKLRLLFYGLNIAHDLAPLIQAKESHRAAI